ncbi:MAG: ATP synthase F1 subunit epsilon [Candidatus Cloacimonas sp. 4484_275]|nr:MAG: ATP synthase F1 subunit epsilon [Candidatus Cloacimonas sp. 4484_275]RLC52170.1 MAG: ATP synthase F1 subunit epsilon [Candidatus Cloacimonadota bacterium]
MSKIHLEVIQPHQTKIKDDFEHVIIPGIEGDFGVSENHTPFITIIRPGILTLFKDETPEKFAIHDGFVTVDNNKVTIVCETIEKSDEIDITRAEEAKKRAEDRLKSKNEEIDFRRAELALKRALVRLSLTQNG